VRFLELCRAWRSRARQGQILHYVGLIAKDAPPPIMAIDPEDMEWASALIRLEASTGFHRLLLDGGRVSLTLCQGKADVALPQQKLQADTVYLGENFEYARAINALVNCCKRGTRLHLPSTVAGSDDALTHLLGAHGFRTDSPLEWVFDPNWPVRRNRQIPRTPWGQSGRCTVIGAGISGASVARVMALRGWQVQVLDAHAQPAAGASGLPAGLVSPVLSADDGALTQLTRSGCALMRQHAEVLLIRGQDWEPTGAWRNRSDQPVLPHGGALQWIPEAFWLKPQALVREWLSTAGIAFTGGVGIHRIERDAEQWVSLGEDGREHDRSDLVVVTNALDAARLLSHATPAASVLKALARMHPRFGAISIGSGSGLANFPTQPLQGHGNFLPAVPLGPNHDRHWLAGSGFEPQRVSDTRVQHQANHARLARQLPDVAATLAPQFQTGQVELWQNQRCVSHDRFPLVGAVQEAPYASLWMSAAMGARGLTLAALCAELLAAQIHGEPLPLPARLARLMDAQRLERQAA